MAMNSSSLSRRSFLAFAGAGGAAAAAAFHGFSAAPAWSAPSFPQNPFTLGVASGDPTSGGIVLWTRLAPEPQALDGMGGMPLRTRSRRSCRRTTDPDLLELVKAVPVRPPRQNWRTRCTPKWTGCARQRTTGSASASAVRRALSATP